MAEITKVSQITYQEAAEYMRIVELSEADILTLQSMINIATAFIQNYTGHTAEELDDYPDFVIVVYVLVQDMWDNRTLYVDNTNLNYVIEAILGMHSINLLSTVNDND